MFKVKTFGTETEMFHLHQELVRLDDQVNAFFSERPQARLVGASDMPVTDEKGGTIGMVRVVAYEE